MYITLTILWSVPISIVALILVFGALYRHWFSYWRKKNINYLEPTFPFGNAFNFFSGRKSFGELFADWYLEMKKRQWPYGGAYFCGKPVFIPVDNSLIKKILISDFILFPNRGLFVDKNEPLSTNLFNLENYEWKNIRSKIPAAFTAAKMRRNVIIMEKISKILVELLQKLSANNQPINIKDVLTRFMVDLDAACLLGINSNTLNNKDEELLKQSRPFFDHQFSRTIITMVVLIPRHILSLFHFKLFPKSTTNYFLDMFKQIKETREKETGKRNDLTDLLIDLCDETKDHPDFNGVGKMGPLTFNEFASQIYVFFEAAFETSSSTLTLTLYELAVNPEIQARLREEIDKVLKKYDGQIGYDSINEMVYLDRVVDETLRKYPIFPILPRVCVNDYQIPDTDITIDKNTFIMVTNLGIQHDPEYYPDPMRFDLDRFIPENKAKRPHCSYMPFGEGPRICVGKRFGIWQTKIGLISVVKNFQISLSKKTKLPLSFVSKELILNAQGSIWLNLDKL
ncbi:hypothetical protein ABEB36_015595 [Hypothenemus hampei]|uniref:Cytochrome P450 n=1 Tax=Hypothenemus hampei TaxID=57062 RepID=A0ABD1DZJ9_HYPHA